MEYAIARQRWDELATAVAAATDADDPQAAGWVAHLERAVGLSDLGAADPASSVTARRFARAHAAAAARDYPGDEAVSAAVAAALAALRGVGPSSPAPDGAPVGTRCRAA